MHGLALADCFEDANPKPIDLLIGLDGYFNFIQGDVIHGKPKEPVALRSKLGWIVSGSVRNDSSNYNSFSSTNLILEGFDSAASENFQENEIVSTLKESGADTGGCTSCTEHRRIFRSKFLIAGFSVFLKNLGCDSLSNFLLCPLSSTRNQCLKFPVAEPYCYVSVQ